MSNTFGQFCKDARIRQGKTLREFCLENGFDAGNVSRVERGLLAPPWSISAGRAWSMVKLASYARALRIQEGTYDWIAFFDLAAVAAGRIPTTVLDDDALLDKLPVLIRTIQGKRLSSDKLDELVEMIRRA